MISSCDLAQPLGAAPAVPVLEQQLLGLGARLRQCAFRRCATAVRNSRSRPE